ncbi:MAG TPA: hypothetical protein ENI87_06925 [bacterium]|nr:hypothetical protein [bacterium]
MQAPIEELMAVGTTFLELLGNRHQSDAMMWRGADRIAEALLSDAARPNRRQLSRWLAQVIERSRSSEAQARRHLLSDLQEVG